MLDVLLSDILFRPDFLCSANVLVLTSYGLNKNRLASYPTLSGHLIAADKETCAAFYIAYLNTTFFYSFMIEMMGKLFAIQLLQIKH